MSPRILLVADDFTGGNAAAARFAAAGARAGAAGHAALAGVIDRFDVVVAITDSRHLSPDEAAQRVDTAIDAAWPVTLVGNRIDTTLRGNIGATTVAALRNVRARTQQPVVALCVPAHPAAGRQTVHGTQLLDGVRLEDTELAFDPLNPIGSSRVAASVASDGLRVAAVDLDFVTGPAPELTAALAAAACDHDVVIVDALTEEHIARIARAAAAVAGVQWLAVDPGPFSTALAKALGLLEQANDTAPILVVSGSASTLTRKQLRRLLEERDCRVVRATGAGGVVDVDAAAAALSQALDQTVPPAMVVVASALDEADVAPLARAESGRLSADVARLVAKAIDGRRLGGLCVIGGDLTTELLERFAARGLEVDGEVIPLAVHGFVVGGPDDGLPIVTKGGLVGGDAAAVQCVAHLEMVRDRLRHTGRHPFPSEMEKQHA